MEPFNGAVMLKDGYRRINGQYVNCVYGRIALIRKEDFDISKSDGDSWALRVSNPENPAAFVVVLGCQVRAVEAMPGGPGPLCQEGFAP